MLDAAKDLQEDLLDHVAGVRGIPKQAVNQVVDGLLKTVDQRLVGLLGEFPQALQQLRIVEGGRPLAMSVRVAVEHKRISHGVQPLAEFTSILADQ